MAAFDGAQLYVVGKAEWPAKLNSATLLLILAYPSRQQANIDLLKVRGTFADAVLRHAPPSVCSRIRSVNVRGVLG